MTNPLLEQIFLTLKSAELGSDKVEIDRLHDYLESEGYRRCYTPECNCGWWHPQEGWYARFKEIEGATNDYYENGETLLERVERISAIALVRDRDTEEVERLRKVADRYRYAKTMEGQVLTISVFRREGAELLDDAIDHAIAQQAKWE